MIDLETADDRDDEVEPTISIAAGHEGHCEACDVHVRVGDHIALYADDVVVHERCPGSRERAQA